MAKKKTPQRARSARNTGRKARVEPASFESSNGSAPMNEIGLETTGKSIVTFLDDSKAAVNRSLSALKLKAGVSNVCRMADFGTSKFSFEAAEGADAIVFDELGIAVIEDGARGASLASLQDSGSADIVVEPDYVNYPFESDLLEEGLLDADDMFGDFDEASPVGSNGASAEFLRGYQQAVQQLINSLTRDGAVPSSADEVDALAVFKDTSVATWGLQATRALSSQASGRGIRVAVLDTGFDLRHPDFQGRSIQTRSFISGETVQDGHGHGTHCIGTACGPRRPSKGPGYGVAFRSEIFAGKVLSNRGSGSDSSILAGIDWAVRNRCQVVSMSLGRPTRAGERPMQSYETAGRRALRAGTLIVAAAGNESNRPSLIQPVASPANASLIAAVAALTQGLGIASFSNRGINPAGGEINFAAPGVSVYSSWPMPLRYRTLSGTSMATPHVAGIAALIAEQSASFRGLALYHELRRRARRLPLPNADVGNGLVEAI